MSPTLVSRMLLACMLLLLALPAAAAPSSAVTMPLNAEKLTCVRNAAYARETRILHALNVHYTRMNNRLEARRTLLKTAWSVSDASKRRTSLKAVWNKFGYAWRTENDLLRDEVNNSWRNYRSARSDCNITGYDEESGGFGMDSQF